MDSSEGYADSGHIMAVEFDKKIIIYWWLVANMTLLSTIIGIVVMIFWVPFGWLIHKKQYEHMSAALTDRSVNMRMGWLFKKQQNIPLGVVRMQFETAGAAPFILTGVKNSEQFRDLVLRQRDSLVSNPQHAGPSISSNEVLVEIRDLLKSIDSRLE